jgi:hypothetical protein
LIWLSLASPELSCDGNGGGGLALKWWSPPLL